MYNAVEAALSNQDIVECSTKYLCSLSFSGCTDSSNKVIVLLTQTSGLTDSSILTDDAARIIAQGATLSISLTVSKKRAVTTVTVSDATAVVSTTCQTGYVQDGEDCAKCPAGYGYNSGTATACEACALSSYSIAENIAVCSACPSDETTMTIGSDNAADCITVNEVCTVTTETDKQTLNPPGGARVKPDSVITVTCDSNYGLEVNASVTFRCDQTAYPTCYGKLYKGTV